MIGDLLGALSAGLLLTAAALLVRPVRPRRLRRSWRVVLGLVAAVAAVRLVAMVVPGRSIPPLVDGLSLLGACILVAAAVVPRRAADGAATADHRFRRMVEHTLDVFVLVNGDGTVVMISPSVLTVLGYTADEMVGRSFEEYVHAQDVELAQTTFARVLEEPGRPVHVEVRARHADGSTRWVEAVAVNLLDDPEVAGVVATFHDITTRRTMEDELRRHEAELRSLTDNAPTIIMRFDRAHRHVFVNRAIEASTGLPPAALLGKTHQELALPPEQVRLWTETLERVFTTGTEALIEFESEGPSGSRRYRSRVVPEFDDEGQVRTALALLDDVTERQEARRALERSLSLLRSTLESSTDGVLVVDRAGRIMDHNQRFAAIWGLPAEVLAARDDDAAVAFVLEQLVNPDEFLVRVREVYDDPEGTSYDVLAFKDGRVIERHSVPHRVDGEPVGRVWTFRDVTAERKAAEALRRSEGSYRTLVEHATHGIYRSTPDGRFLAVNPALVRMLGYDSAHELMALDLAVDVYADRGTRERLIAFYSDSERISGAEVEWRRRDGEQVLVRLSGRPVRTSDGAIECYEMMVEDVTERRALEAQLRQAQKMEAVGQLTGGIAHDFNNLLTVILANADMLARALPDDRDDLRADLRELRDAARRGSEMVRKLLGYSRRDMLVLRPLDLVQVVRNLLPMLGRVLPESIEVQFRADHDGATIRADEGALEQMVLNLATNARDAMPDGGRLRLIVTTAQLAPDDPVFQDTVGGGGRYVTLTVADTGHGMDQATLERIFDPFFTTKPPGVGTGLGMAMIYGLARQQQGFIDVKSSRGVGTTIRLCFPFVEMVGTTPRGARAATPRVSEVDGSETILLVEDEPPIRRAAKRLLQKRGYTVLLAEDGVEALKLIAARESEINLVISDVVMPRMGGAQLRRELAARGCRIPFLFTSGYTARDMREVGELDPSVPFVQKPWELDEFLGTIREVLNAAEHVRHTEPKQTEERGS